MADKISDNLYELERAESSMSDALTDCDGWNDDVNKSYQRYVDEIHRQMSSLSFMCEMASNAINNAAYVDVGKYKKELEEYAKKVRSI